MPRKIEKLVYTFGELSDAAKERARNWYRQGNAMDTWYVDSCIENTVIDAARMLGITIDTPRGQRTGYAIDWDTNPIGAAFVGSWHASAVKYGAIAKEWPVSPELHAIAHTLETIATVYPDACANCDTGRGCYQRVEAYANDGGELDADDACGAIVDALQDFAFWIATTINAEIEWQNSDECVDGSIEANGYEFDEDGRPHA